MATMLAFLTTDASVSNPFLQDTLAQAVNRSFNRITIDGDMSTNDSVLLMANGASGLSIEKNPKAFELNLPRQSMPFAPVWPANASPTARK